MPWNSAYVKLESSEKKKVKLSFMIYADLSGEIILVPEDNEKPNLNESYTKKYHIFAVMVIN